MKKKTYLNFLFLLVFASWAPVLSASDLTSPSFIIRDPVIGTMGGYGTSSSFKLYSSGETLFTGEAASPTYMNRYGFQNYPFAESGVLTAAQLGLDASLSWTASTAGGGWTVSGYNTGISNTAGGPYTYTSVGNALSYSYEDLAPGEYCFILETLDAYGDVIAASNEECITIEQTLVFDLDTASDFSNSESSSPYSVDLGTLTISSVKASNSSSVGMIVAEADTNAAGGIIVTVQNANGANGLVSASSPGDNINSSDATMSSGAENYGLCVATSGLMGFSAAGGYSGDTCALGSGTNTVEGLSASPEDILSTGGAPAFGAHAEIVVNGSVSGTTPAHNDYSDMLTFIATGSF